MTGGAHVKNDRRSIACQCLHDASEAADFPFDERLPGYSDLTINLLRRPVGEWICLDARTELGPNGCGHAESTIYDRQGLIGRALQTLALDRRG